MRQNREKINKKNFTLNDMQSCGNIKGENEISERSENIRGSSLMSFGPSLLRRLI